MNNKLSPLIAALLALTAGAARAELTDIAWDGNGRFTKLTDIAPGKFAEVCGRLAQGQTVRWSFKSQQTLQFNIHYHEGKAVVFPVKQDAVMTAEGDLAVALDQDYCWMWTNKTRKPARLTVALQR